jgi:hypothetical protein
MELFTFIRVGGTRDRIFLAELSTDVGAALARISATKAACTVAGDRQRLLAVIETGFGDLRPFNRVVRGMFVHIMTSQSYNIPSVAAGVFSNRFVRADSTFDIANSASAEAEAL